MLFLPKDFCVGSFFSLSGKTPHPSAYGCHLLPPEKAGKVHVTVESKSILHIGWLLCNTKFKKRLCLRQISLLRREKVSRLAAADEALSHAYFQSKLRLAVFAPVLRPIFLPYLLSLPILIYFMSLKTDKKAKQSFSCEKAFPFYGIIYLRIICKQIKIFAFLS